MVTIILFNQVYPSVSLLVDFISSMYHILKDTVPETFANCRTNQIFLHTLDQLEIHEIH